MFKPDDIKRVYMYDEKIGWEDTVPYDDDIAQAIDMYEMIKDDEIVGAEMSVEYEVYSPEFDTKCRISTSQPTDRAFHMEMGKELLMQQLIDEETFYYILQHGKFPPYETIVQKRKKEMVSHAQISQDMQRREEEKAMEEQMIQQQGPPPEMGGMPPEGGGAPPGGMPPEAPPEEVLQQIFAERPDLYEQYMQLPPDAQQQLVQQLLGGAM